MKRSSLSFSLLLLLSLLASGCGRSPERLAQRGLASLNAGDPAAAAELLEQALADRGEDSAAAPLWGALGLARARAGRAGTAEDAFRVASTLAPDDFLIHYNLGGLLMREGRFAEAIAPFRVASRAKPDRPESLELMAAAALNLGDNESALDWLTEASRRREDPRVLSSLAALVAERGDIPEARRLLRRALDLESAHEPSTFNMAVLLDSAGIEPARANHYYERYLQLSPGAENADGVRARMDILAARAERDGHGAEDPVVQEIRTFLEQARRAAGRGEAPLALNYCIRAANAAERRGRPDLQEQALREGVRLAPSDRRAPFALGRFLAQRGRHPEALAAYRDAGRIAPDWLPALMGQAESAIAARQPAPAREALQRAERVAVDDPDTLLIVARLYQDGLNDAGASRRVLRDLQQRFPNHPRMDEIRQRLR